MIKLIFAHTSPPEICSFDKQKVIIGSDGQTADLVLPGENILSAHVLIEEKDGHFLVTNLANDPFVSLNELPFGKRLIHNNDCLQIGRTALRFEGHSHTKGEESASKHTPKKEQSFLQEQPEDTLVAQPQQKVTITHLEELLEKKIENQREILRDSWANTPSEALHHASPMVEKTDFPAAEQLTSFSKETELEVEELFKQVEELETEHRGSTPMGIIYSQTLANDNSVAAAEQEEQRPTATDDDPVARQTKRIVPRGKGSWLAILAIIIAVLLLCLLFLFHSYENLLKRAQERELQTASDAADVAMALFYAKIHNIQPQNHNWTDLQFLQNNLASILPPSSSAGGMHSSWAIANDSEPSHSNLRIYTSNNLSRFLVVLQPTPSLWQWLTPHPIIVIDSEQMLLRKTWQYKELNRLLLDPELFSKGHEQQISDLLHQFDIIPLELLARSHTEGMQYHPPKALALLRPGAENKIYNAPRYYLFGEAILEKARAFFPNAEGIGQDPQPIDAEALYPLPDMVFYSSYGLAQAQHNQQILQTLSPLGQVLTAYLRFNAQGKLVGSHLLIGDNRSGRERENPSAPTPLEDSSSLPPSAAGTLLAEAIETGGVDQAVSSPSEIADAKAVEASPGKRDHLPVLQQIEQQRYSHRAQLTIQGQILAQAITALPLHIDSHEKALSAQKAHIDSLYTLWVNALMSYEEQLLSTFRTYLAQLSPQEVQECLQAAAQFGLAEWAYQAASPADRDIHHLNLDRDRDLDRDHDRDLN